MAESVDLDEWELLSPDSSSKDEFEEVDLTNFDYFSKDLERRGEISGAEKAVEFNCSDVMLPVVGDCSGENLAKLSSNFNSEKLVTDSDKDCSDLARGFDERDANFVRDNPIEDLVFSDNFDRKDSIGELGFGEIEVLNEFYSNQVDAGVVNYETSGSKIENDLKGESEQFSPENPVSSVLAFQGIDNSDSVFSSETNGECWESRKAVFTKAIKEKGGFFEMEMDSSQIKNSNGGCSKGLNGINSGTHSSNDNCFNLAKDCEQKDVNFDENKPKISEGGMVNLSNMGVGGNKEKDLAKKEISKVQKEEKALLAWWKIPIEVIKFCIFGVRPIWSISMAMGFLGFLMFSRSFYLYKMNQKDNKIRPPLKVRFDEKKRAMVQTRAARLNQTVSLVRPDPILRTPHPAFGLTPFPAMSSFQWAP